MTGKMRTRPPRLRKLLRDTERVKRLAVYHGESAYDMAYRLYRRVCRRDARFRAAESCNRPVLWSLVADRLSAVMRASDGPPGHRVFPEGSKTIDEKLEDLSRSSQSNQAKLAEIHSALARLEDDFHNLLVADRRLEKSFLRESALLLMYEAEKPLHDVRGLHRLESCVVMIQKVAEYRKREMERNLNRETTRD